MDNYQALARLIILMGIFLLIIGIIILLMGKINFPFFNLPGDIYVKKENFTFYFPIVSCIILSIVLSILFNFFRR